MRIGIIERLWRYPVKSLAPEALTSVDVGAGGFPGDRAGALMVTTPGHARAGKPLRGKEHHLLHTVSSPAAAAALAAAAGVGVDVVRGEHFFDAQPVSLIWDTWLRDVETLAGRDLDPLRYRPNIFVRAAHGFAAAERELVGATVAAGGAVLRVVATIGRCVTTTYDVATGESDPAVLRAVAQHRANTLGIYCTVERPGTAALHDGIELLTPAPPPAGD
jgi:uncharacterized protein YcbX